MKQQNLDNKPDQGGGANANQTVKKPLHSPNRKEESSGKASQKSQTPVKK